MHKTKDPQIVNIFRNAFLETSAFLKTKLLYEKQSNQYNLESGLPLEDYFRQEFGRFIPDFYSVDAGKIIDREHYTCGDCDFVIYNKSYAPFVKFPSTQHSRRKLLAFETTYGIIEVKQKLTLGATKNEMLIEKPSGTLYDACNKIFAYKELSRDTVDSTKVIPGFTIPSLLGEEVEYNKPFGFGFFYDADIDLDDQTSVKNLVTEFWLINQTVPPPARVNGFFVLDKFAVTFVKDSGLPSPTHLVALHPSEVTTPTFSIIKSGPDTLYLMYVFVWNLLLKTHLNNPNFNADYGGAEFLQDFKQIRVSLEK